MDITIMVSKVLGVYLVLAGLFLLLRGKTLPHMLKDFFQHPAMVYLVGVILLFLSSIYLVGNNIWEGSWKTVITVFVWMVFIKAVMYILWPEKLEKMARKFKGGFKAYGVVAILVGIYLFMLP